MSYDQYSYHAGQRREPSICKAGSDLFHETFIFKMKNHMTAVGH